VESKDVGEPSGAGPTRRSVLLAGGAAFGGAAAALIAGSTVANAATSGEYAWAANKVGLTVPHATWTKIPWPHMLLNTTAAHVAIDGATWIFPVPAAAGIYSLLCNVAWDNARSPANKAIAPVTHRKLARIVQQEVGVNQTAFVGACSDLTYHADLAARGDRGTLADGSKGYQQQQVFVQAGIAPDSAQRTWVEVYQDSGQPLACRFDGSSAAMTATRPRVLGLLAPSLMIAKLCDF
jgi:hypothetical protein